MIRNLTPHTIVYQRPDGTRVDLPSEGVARVSTTTSNVVVDLDGFSIHGADRTGAITGLPELAPGEYALVSAVVGAAVYDQYQSQEWARRVIVPGTGPNDNPVRENGQVVAVTRFKFVMP